MVDRYPTKSRDKLEQGYIAIVKQHPTGEITSLMHEMVHLALAWRLVVGTEMTIGKNRYAFLAFLPRERDNPMMLYKRLPKLMFGRDRTVLECEVQMTTTMM